MSKLISTLTVGMAAAVATLLTTVYAQETTSTDEKKLLEVPASNFMVRPFKVSDFQMEIGLLSAFFLYFLLWSRGKSTNMTRANHWLQGQIEYFQQQFALVGDNKSNKLVKDGPADFLLYTTGRRNVQFGHWWFKMKKRNDMLTLFTTTVLSKFTSTKPSVDRMDVTLQLDKNLPEKFVFAVIRKDLAADLHKKRFDLNRVGKIASSKLLSDEYNVYAETQKLADTILTTTKMTEWLKNKAPGRLEHLILSSLPAEEPIMYDNDNHMSLSLSFLMPEGKDVDTLDPFVELACQIPDVLQQLRLPADVKTKINKNREDLLKEFSKKKAADRAEELAKKKAEAKRAEEERIKKLSPAEQRKWEEKERARTMKKQMKRRKV
ncbi:hypothetical protein BDF20DRAFT_909482 [Mycotypha africana]|uniref:uncharacterized protein n=1 Tax=Mycotypha africana TaxID=64632 RepID=UPI00230191B8|nr:uncharacterized protein BDF20DRAFT_909482 [Mycotypha africana]KAI8991748.1 hypothetical protein BDF20DRAFT_909482 [Mycotypha africana]